MIHTDHMNSDSQPLRRFMCKFGGGISCKLDVTAEAPKSGEPQVVRIQWEGLPDGKVPKQRARRLMHDYEPIQRTGAQALAIIARSIDRTRNHLAVQTCF